MPESLQHFGIKEELKSTLDLLNRQDDKSQDMIDFRVLVKNLANTNEGDEIFKNKKDLLDLKIFVERCQLPDTEEELRALQLAINESEGIETRTSIIGAFATSLPKLFITLADEQNIDEDVRDLGNKDIITVLRIAGAENMTLLELQSHKMGDETREKYKKFVVSVIENNKEYILQNMQDIYSVDRDKAIIAYETLSVLDLVAINLGSSLNSANMLAELKKKIKHGGEVDFEDLKEGMQGEGIKKISAILEIDEESAKTIIENILGDGEPLSTENNNRPKEVQKIVTEMREFFEEIRKNTFAHEILGDEDYCEEISNMASGKEGFPDLPLQNAFAIYLAFQEHAHHEELFQDDVNATQKAISEIRISLTTSMMMSSNTALAKKIRKALTGNILISSIENCNPWAELTEKEKILKEFIGDTVEEGFENLIYTWGGWGTIIGGPGLSLLAWHIYGKMMDKKAKKAIEAEKIKTQKSSTTNNQQDSTFTLELFGKIGDCTTIEEIQSLYECDIDTAGQLLKAGERKRKDRIDTTNTQKSNQSIKEILYKHARKVANATSRETSAQLKGTRSTSIAEGLRTKIPGLKSAHNKIQTAWDLAGLGDFSHTSFIRQVTSENGETVFTNPDSFNWTKSQYRAVQEIVTKYEISTDTSINKTNGKLVSVFKAASGDKDTNSIKNAENIYKIITRKIASGKIDDDIKNAEEDIKKEEERKQKAVENKKQREISENAKMIADIDADIQTNKELLSKEKLRLAKKGELGGKSELSTELEQEIAKLEQQKESLIVLEEENATLTEERVQMDIKTETQKKQKANTETKIRGRK